MARVAKPGFLGLVMANPSLVVGRSSLAETIRRNEFCEGASRATSAQPDHRVCGNDQRPTTNDGSSSNSTFKNFLRQVPLRRIRDDRDHPLPCPNFFRYLQSCKHHGTPA